MVLTLDVFGHHMALQGVLSHRTDLGGDLRGNITRLDNVLEKLPERLDAARAHLEDLRQQAEAARAEAGKPFPREEELKAKSARLAELDAQLNLSGYGTPEPAA